MPISSHRCSFLHFPNESTHGIDSCGSRQAQGRSLNPGRYVGVAERAADDFDFAERLMELNEELERLNGEARMLEKRIAENVGTL